MEQPGTVPGGERTVQTSGEDDGLLSLKRNDARCRVYRVVNGC